MESSDNSLIKANTRSIKAILYFAIFLIILGIGNIIFSISRTQVYAHVYAKLEASKNLSPEADEGSLYINESIRDADQEKIESRLKRAKARLDFYRFVGLGGKSFLVIAAMLILYCLYYSKEFDRKLAITIVTAFSTLSRLM